MPAGTYPIEVVADADNSISAFGPANLKFDAGTTTVVYAVGSFSDGSFTPLLQTFPELLRPPEHERRTGRPRGRPVAVR